MDILLAAAPTLEDALRHAEDYAPGYPFQFDMFLTGLLWGVWVVLNLWIWQKTKALGNMLMLCGSAGLALFFFIHSFTWRGPGQWLVLMGTAALSVGFFLSVRPLVEAQLAALKAKLHSGKGSDGSTPPPPKP